MDQQIGRDELPIDNRNNNSTEKKIVFHISLWGNREKKCNFYFYWTVKRIQLKSVVALKRRWLVILSIDRIKIISNWEKTIIFSFKSRHNKKKRTKQNQKRARTIHKSINTNNKMTVNLKLVEARNTPHTIN